MQPAVPGEPGLVRRFLAILAVVGLAFVVLAGGGAAVYYARARLLDLVVVAVALAIWGLVASLRPAWRPASTLIPGFVAVVSVFLLSALVSRSPRIGLEYAAYAAILAPLYLLLRQLLVDRFFRDRLLLAMPLLCVIIAVAYIGIVLADWAAWWAALGRLAAPPLRPRIEGLTYANPSTVMAALMLLLSASAAWLGVAGRRAMAVAALTALVLLASFLTGSRGGLVGLAAGVAALTATAVLVERERLITAIRRPSRVVRRAIAAAAVAAVGVGAVFGPEVLARLTASGGDLRVSFAVASLRQFAERPVTGTGPGLWAVNRVAYSVAEDRDRYIPHAHNIELQSLAEFGLLGVVAGLFAGLLVARIVVPAIRAGAPEQRRWGYAAVFSLAYLVGHQQVDLFANSPAVMLVGAVPVAVLDADALVRGRFALPPWLRTRVAVAWAVGLAVALPVLMVVESRAVGYEAAVGTANRGEWAAALPVLRAAAEEDADVAPYQFALGLAEARAGGLERAAAAFERAAAFDDYPPSWVNVAAVRLRLGDEAGGRDALDRAMRLGRQHPAVAVAAGELWLQLGEQDRAISAYADAIAFLPSLAGDPAWVTRPELAPVWPEVLEAARARATPAVAWEIALAIGDVREARSLLNELAESERASATLVTDAVAGVPGAVERALAAFDRAPLDPYRWKWAPRLAEAAGQADRAEGYREQSRAVNPFAALDGRSARFAERDPGASDIVVNESSIFHGLYAYRRPLPLVQLVPWLSQLVWE